MLINVIKIDGAHAGLLVKSVLTNYKFKIITII